MAKKSDITKTFKWRISQIPQILEWVEKQDVDGLSRFLVQSPNIPLYCFSSGGASSSLHYCALLYETNKGMAKALTPLMMTSLSDETLKNSKILLFSKSGHGIDEEQIVKRAVKVNPQGVYAMSRDNDKENHLIQTVIEKTGTNNWLQFKWPEFEDAFISSTSPFAIMGLFYKAFSGDSDIVSKLNIDLTSSNCYSYKTKRGDIIEEPKSNIKTFIALYSGWSEPTAIDFESKMVESGIASVQLCDYRNFCHGRFIFLSNHLEDSAFVLFVTPREKEFVRRFIYEAKGDMGQRELFPSDTKIITIETELDSPLATIDLMIKTSVCFMDIAKDYGQEPLNPTNPYKIDKRCPRSFPYTGLVKTPLMSNVIQGKKGTLKGVNRRKQIIYDAYKSIAELAEKNGVEEPTVRKYIRAHKIDRNRDLQMIQYNKVWEEFIKDSTRSKASIARTLGISENTLKFYLSMKTPPKTDEGKNGTVAESKPLTKLREKLKDKEWDLNLTFKDGAVVKETDEKRQEVRKSVEGNVKGIIGAVIGEVIGSRFEFSKPPTRKVDRFTAASTFTDDTVLTVAVADALLHNRDFGEAIFEWARKYPNAGFGMRFRQLMKGKKGISTDSLGNGGGMRVSPIGFHAKTLEEALELARQSAIPSHNSIEGIKGAKSIAAATFLAKQQLPKEEIKAYIEKEFGYNLDRSDEEIAEFVNRVRSEKKTEWAENTCPLAIIAFLTTDDYESSIWKSISYGCDTDTVACMCGGIAAAYYGVPQDIINEVTDYLPHEILNIINEFDHTNLQNSRITPKKYDRWGAALVYGSGSDQIVDEKEHIIDEGGFEARQHFGASLKVREGFKKRSYAIPTMGRTLKEIKEGVDRFIEFAENHQEETFMVIEIGCKKAGFTPMQIAPMFEKAKKMSNVYLPKVFIEVPMTWEKNTRKKKEIV